LSRRSLLVGGAAGTAALGAGTWAIARGLDSAQQPTADPVPQTYAEQTVPFHGTHQPGVTTLPAQAHATFVALDLRDGVDRAQAVRMLRLLTDNTSRLMAGHRPLASEDVELAARPARLTVTVGFGAGLFDAAGLGRHCPVVVRHFPSFATDRLQPAWSGGDVVLQVCSDEPTTVSFATRWLVRDARPFAKVRWAQRGFTQARGTEQDGTTMRNVMGMRDGSANPSPQTGLDDAVWNTGPGWLTGGSMLVLRRIAIDVEAWDDFGREGRQLAIGRTLDAGAPLTGGAEHDAIDPTKTDQHGLPVLQPSAHAVRAQARSPAERMLRRGYNYDDGPGPDGRPQSGLLFAAYQADAETAFIPVQHRLATLDALNLWTTHIGSVAVAVPPGCPPGEYLGQGLLDG
jgi:dye decolorizing peroxidase